MRHRRAERCRLRAEVAIEAGSFDDAREALAEARLLHPRLPMLAGTEARLAEAERPAAPVAPERRRRGVRGFALVASIVLIAGLAGWLMIPAEPASTPPTGTAAASRPALGGAFDGDTPAATTGPAPLAPLPAAAALTSVPDDRSAVAGDSGGIQPAQPAADSLTQPEPASPLVSAAPVIEVPPPTAAAPRNLAPLEPAAVPSTDVPAPPLPTATPALPPPSTPAPSAPAPSAASSTPEPEPSAAARTVAAAPSAEMQVRAALSRYEAAYSTLDVAAARAVWPAVDANALGRAFDDLRSQRVSLGNCSVVIGPGRPSARADCTGAATWTPKVGGGARTAARRWTFELELAGGRWQIVRAITR